MPDALVAADGSVTFARLSRVSALARQTVAPDTLTAAVIVLLILAWGSEGVRAAVGLPHVVVGVVDVGELLLIAVVGVRVAREVGVRWVPWAVVLYGAWILLGLATHARAAAVVISLKDMVLVPGLALIVAARGTSERRAQAIVAALFALGGLEFVVTLVQSFLHSNPDSVVGTFGPSANAVAGAVVLLLAAVGIAGFVTRAPHAPVVLAVSAALPLLSAWSIVKFVPIALPFAALAVVVPARALRLTTTVRAAIAVGAMVAASALVLLFYAAFHPDSFSALFNTQEATNYLNTASSTGTATPPAATRVLVGPFVAADYANSVVAPAATPFGGGPTIRVWNAAAGDYTAWFARADGSEFRVHVRQRYTFSAVVGFGSGDAQSVAGQIEWHARNGRLLSVAEGATVSLFGASAAPSPLTVSGVAPAGSATAMLKIAVTGSPAAGSSIEASSLHFARGRAVRAVTAPHRRRRPAPAPTTTQAPPSAQPAPYVPPGRLTQWRLANRAISGSAFTELFGKGTGSATVADNLGVHPSDLAPDERAASYSDFGVLLVERGWVGVTLVALLGLLIAGAALRIVRTLPPGRWTTALTIAVPGAVAVMAAYGLVADQLQNRASSLTFWVIVALGLSPGAFLARRRPRP